MPERRAEALAFGALALLAIALFLLAPTYPGLDTSYHLVWGRELLDGQTPSFDGYRAPTHHPLWVGIGALLALAGEDADRLAVLVALLCLVAFLWAVYRLGRAQFGVWPGVAAVVLAGGSFAFLLYAVRAFVDVPFLALVLWAAVLARERGRERPWGAMALLALAGLLRPEAWLLAALWWLWCRPAAALGRRAGLAALAAAAPAAWLAIDWASTGDPLFSFTSTSQLAEELRHEGGPAEVPVAYAELLSALVRPPVLLVGAAGLVLAVRREGWRAVVVPLTLVAAGSAAFAVVGLAGLSILPRYLTVPAAALCVFAGYAVLGWTRHPAARRWRRLGLAAVAVGVVAGLVLAALSAGRVAAELRFVRGAHDDLAALLADSRVRAALRCGPLVLPADRVVPEARWQLDAPPAGALARTAPERRGRAGVYVTVRGGKSVERLGEAAGIPRTTNRPPPRAAAVVRAGRFTGYVQPCPRAAG